MAPQDAACAELLRKAVVSLEKKLQQSKQEAAALQAAVQRLEQETQELPAVRGRLAEALSTQQELQRQCDQWQRETVQARAERECLQQQRDAAQAAQQTAEAAQARQAEQAAQWRADCEASRLAEARARGQAEMLEQQVEQLEAANSDLRLGAKQHAAKLKEAYEREAELLTEVAELQGQLRRTHAQQAAASSSSSSSSSLVPPQLPALCGSDGEGQEAGHSMEHMHRGLFMAAAQQLKAECAAKVEQAQRKAGELEVRLESMTDSREQLQLEASDLKASLQAAQARCSQEQQRAQDLLASNMRLHEMMMQLIEQGTAGGMQPAAAASAAPHAAPPAPAVTSGRHARAGRVQAQEPPLPVRQQQQRLPGAQRQARPAAPAPRRPISSTSTKAAGSLGNSGKHRLKEAAAEQREMCLPAADKHESTDFRIAAQRAAVKNQDSWESVEDAAAAGQLACRSSPPAQPPPPSQQQQQQQDEARQAAIQAALSLSAEYRELLGYYRQVAAELQRVNGSLAAMGPAAPGKQAQLLREQAELQQELREVSQQVEHRMLQMTALRQAGLL